MVTDITLPVVDILGLNIRHVLQMVLLQHLLNVEVSTVKEMLSTENAHHQILTTMMIAAMDTGKGLRQRIRLHDTIIMIGMRVKRIHTATIANRRLWLHTR